MAVLFYLLHVVLNFQPGLLPSSPQEVFSLGPGAQGPCPTQPFVCRAEVAVWRDRGMGPVRAESVPPTAGAGALSPSSVQTQAPGYWEVVLLAGLALSPDWQLTKERRDRGSREGQEGEERDGEQWFRSPGALPALPSG